MIRRCEVYENNQAAGTVIMGRRGLYWAVSCRCDTKQGRGKRLIAEAEGRTVDLGLLYPVDGMFGLETSVSVKCLGDGKICFRLAGRQQDVQLFELDPEKEFLFLDMLEQCRFCIHDAKPCIILPRKK